jgi:purine-cytosine permease-like protein
MAGGAGLGACAAALVALGWPWGAAVALPGVAALATGAALSALRGEEKRAATQEHLIGVIAGVVILALGIMETRADATLDGLILALAALAAVAIGERTQAVVKRWWGSPAGYLLLVTPFAIAGRVSWGLAAIAIYAVVTLAAAVESRREKP